MSDTNLREQELQRYWRTMQDAGRVFPEIDSRDELELLSQMSEWPRLRDAAARNITRFDFNRWRRVANAR